MAEAAQPIPDEIPPPPPRRRWRGVLKILLLLLLVGTAVGWYVQQRLITHACANLSSLLRLPLQCVNARGTLPGTLRIDLLRYSTPKVVVELKGILLRPRLSWLIDGRAVFREASVKELSIFVLKHSGKPVELPRSMALPLPMEIDKASVGRLSYYDLDRPPLVFDSITTYALLEKAQWTVSETSAEFMGMRLAGRAQMKPQLPYALAGVVRMSGNWRSQRVNATITARGELDKQVALEASGRLGRAPAELDAILTLTARHVLPEARASVQNWPLHEWIPGMPQLDADVQALARPDDEGWHGELKVLNRSPGPLDRKRLPATEGSTAWAWRPATHSLHLDRLRLGLPDGGELKGRLGWNGGLDIDASGRAIDLARFWSSLKPTRLNGPFSVSTDDYKRYRIKGNLQQAGDRLRAEGTVDAEGAEATVLSWRRGQASIDGRGRVSFDAGRAFEARLALKAVDPAAFGHFPAGNINGQVDARGTLLPRPDIQLQASIERSTLFNSPLMLKGSGRYRGDTLALKQTHIRLDGAEARLDGALGAPGSRMSLRATLDGQQRWLPQLSARARVEGELLGALRWPGFRGRITARDLRYGPWTVRQLEAQGDSNRLAELMRNRLPALQLQLKAEGLAYEALTLASLQGSISLAGHEQALHLALQGRQLESGARRAEEITLQVDGPLKAHQLNLEIVHTQQKLAFGAQGALDPATLRWQGLVRRVDGSGRLPLQLVAPARLDAGPQYIDLADLRLISRQFSLEVDSVRWRGRQWSSQGRFAHLPLRDFIALGGKPPPPLSLVLGGEWQFNYQDTLSGVARLYRESGDIQPVEDLQGLGLDRGVFELKAEQNRVTAELDINSKATGRIQGRLSTTLSERNGRLGLAGTTPVKGRLALNIPSLNWLGQWFSTPGYSFGGTLQGEVDVAGTVAEPSFQGRLTGRRIAARAAVYGLDWRNGEIDARIEHDRIVVERLGIDGGEGRLKGSGLLSLRENDPDISVDLTASRLTVLSRPDQKLVISGSGRATLRDKRLALNADVKVDRGLVTLKSSEDTALDDDIVLPEKRRAALREQKKIGIYLSAKVDLGNDFQVKHRSFNAEAQGVLRMESSPVRPATLTGNVEVDKGNLYSYGQKLTLETGSSLNFNGPPDNPSFNLRAFRDRLPINAKTGIAPKVGVHVTGTARKPVLRLISEPELTDREKLSLLIFGQDLNTKGENNNEAVLSTAATAIFSELGDGGPGVLNRVLGVDEVSVEKNTADVSKGVVRLGKQLIPNLYVSYGKGYKGAADELQINYLFNQNWSIEAKSSDTTAVDIFYTISFD